MNKINTTDFYNRLAELCKSRNIMQKTMCKDVGFKEQHFRNKKSLGYMPTLEQILVLAQYFNVSIEYLLTGTTDDPTFELKTCKDKLNKINAIINDTSSTL